MDSGSLKCIPAILQRGATSVTSCLLPFPNQGKNLLPGEQILCSKIWLPWEREENENGVAATHDILEYAQSAQAESRFAWHLSMRSAQAVTGTSLSLSVGGVSPGTSAG